MEQCNFINKYDCIKRKNRNPSLKALLTIQLSSSLPEKRKTKTNCSESLSKKCLVDSSMNQGHHSFQTSDTDGISFHGFGTSEVDKKKKLQICQNLIDFNVCCKSRETPLPTNNALAIDEFGTNSKEGKLKIVTTKSTEPGISFHGFSYGQDSFDELSYMRESDFTEKGYLSQTIADNSEDIYKLKKKEKEIPKIGFNCAPKLDYFPYNSSSTTKKMKYPEKEVSSLKSALTTKIEMKPKGACLQDALSDAVDFFSITEFDDQYSENEYSEVHPFDKKVEKDVLMDTTNIKNIVRVQNNLLETKAINKKIKLSKDADHGKTLKGDTAEDTNVEMVAKHIVSNNTGLETFLEPSRVQNSRKTVCPETALQFAMSDAITHWLTTGQVQYCGDTTEENQFDVNRIAQKAQSDVHKDMHTMPEKAFENEDVIAKKACAPVISLSRFKLLKISEKVNLEPNSALHFISDISKYYRQDLSNKEDSRIPLNCCSGEEDLADKSAKGDLFSLNTKNVKENTFISHTYDVNAIDSMTNQVKDHSDYDHSTADTEPYCCPLKLRLDPTLPQPHGTIEKLFVDTFIEHHLSKKEECFSSCYEKYQALITRADEFEKKRQKEAPIAVVTSVKINTKKSLHPRKKSKKKRRKKIHCNAIVLGNYSDGIHNGQVKSSDRCGSKPFITSSTSTAFNSETSKSLERKRRSWQFEQEQLLSSCLLVETAELTCKREKLQLQLPIPRETFSTLSEKFVQFAKLYEKPYLEGWVREVVYRNIISSKDKKYDVYYFTPDKHKIRSFVELRKYLTKHNLSHLSCRNFDFFKEQHNVGHPYETVRPASARHFWSRSPQSALHNEYPNKLFDFLGFEDSDDSINFEGFTLEDSHDYGSRLALVRGVDKIKRKKKRRDKEYHTSIPSTMPQECNPGVQESCANVNDCTVKLKIIMPKPSNAATSDTRLVSPASQISAEDGIISISECSPIKKSAEKLAMERSPYSVTSPESIRLSDDPNFITANHYPSNNDSFIDSSGDEQEIMHIERIKEEPPFDDSYLRTDGYSKQGGDACNTLAEPTFDNSRTDADAFMDAADAHAAAVTSVTQFLIHSVSAEMLSLREETVMPELSESEMPLVEDATAVGDDAMNVVDYEPAGLYGDESGVII